MKMENGENEKWRRFTQLALLQKLAASIRPSAANPLVRRIWCAASL
jgi:hypothetical protein